MNGLRPLASHNRRRPSQQQRRLRVEALEARLLLTVAPNEQLFVYLLNRARHDPVAYQQEAGISVDLSYVESRGPLAVNDSLFASSEFHAVEMATHNYFAHQSQVTGEWPNQMAADAGYPLPSWWSLDANYIESLAAGTSTAAGTLKLLIVDAGISPPGHRDHLLGIGDFNAANRDIGVGYGYNASSTYDDYWAIHAAQRGTPINFLTGVVFHDANGNQRYDLNEGLSGVTVSSGSQSTTTNAAGGWALPLGSGTYTVTAAGAGFVGTATAQATSNGENIEVDFLSGSSTGWVDFQAPAAAASPTTIGLFDPSTNVFYLRGSNSTGYADYTFGYGDPTAAWTELVGNWDGVGGDTIGFFDPQSCTWYLRNSLTAGYADWTFGYGDPLLSTGHGDGNWVPLVGDWDGNGTDTIGFLDPSTCTWYLRNSLTTGFADWTFGYGDPSLTTGHGDGNWVPLVGDWDNNGTDTIGFFDPGSCLWYLRDALSTGFADHTFGYGDPSLAVGHGANNWVPIVGDWNGNGADTIGFYDPQNSLFMLGNALTTGAADLTFGFGQGGAGWHPLVGTWATTSPASASAPPQAQAVDQIDLAALAAEQLRSAPFGDESFLLPAGESAWKAFDASLSAGLES